MTKQPRIVLPLAVAALLALSVAENALAAGSAPSGTPPAIHAAVLCPSKYINARVLAANVAETETAPTFTETPAGLIAVFSATCTNWFYSVSGTAAVPIADVTDGGAAFRAVTALRMKQGGTLSIVADAVCTVTIAYSFEYGGACE